ncbi:MAG: hypothetical protein ABH864_00895 [archaeon]
MPLCGFNQEMLEGMNKFHQGLVESVLDKTLADEGSGEELREEK